MPSLLMSTICLLFLAGLGSSSSSSSSSQVLLTAELDYGTFRGAYSSVYNISYWQKIPFAAPPTGLNRFRAPQPPLPITDGVYDSSEPFDMCPQRTVNGSEDCLYLGLYGRPWTRGAPLRPVVVTFYGGGFIQGSASFGVLPPSAYPILNVSEASNLIFVYPNYRVNAFGFLPGKEVADDELSDADAGLLDQRAALRWTRKYIALFGGDPERVTVWGQSAGGGSVLAQSIADHGSKGSEGDGDGPLFRQALASSPFWPKTYAVDAPEAQWRYDALANMTGCAGPQSLACLKSVDVQVIRDASLVIVDSHKYGTSTFEWGPVIDGVFLREPLSAATSTAATTRKRGRKSSNIVAGYGMYNTHEGENFVPSSLKGASADDFAQWVSDYLPSLPSSSVDRLLNELYPEVGSAEHITSYNDSFTRAGLVYRDSTLACPALWMARSAEEGSWIGEYTISPAQHASDVYWWNTINSAQQQDPLHYKGYAGALASFFMTGDLNALKLTADDVSGVPDLSTGREWVINSAGFTNAELVQLKERCAFWEEVAGDVPI